MGDEFRCRKLTFLKTWMCFFISDVDVRWVTPFLLIDAAFGSVKHSFPNLRVDNIYLDINKILPSQNMHGT